jgi:3-dehydroquinate synthase class II
VFRNSDIPGADELADRLVKSMPPELTADEDDQGQQLAQQVRVLGEQNEQMKAALAQANDDIFLSGQDIDSAQP